MARLNTPTKFLLGFAALSVVGYLGLCALLYTKQRSMMYHPQPLPPGAEAATIRLRAEGPRVLVTQRDVVGADAIVYFGGNGEVVANLLPGFAAAFPRHALYLLHYRGYAGSEGEPTEHDLYSDALALFDHAHAKHARVIVVGRSLGSGLAVRVASVRPATRLVLVTPYDSIAGIASEQYPFFPISMILHDRYDSHLYAPKVRAPTRIILAGNDQVIPRHSTEMLYSRFAPGVASMVEVRGAAHNNVSEDPRYLGWFIAP